MNKVDADTVIKIAKGVAIKSSPDQPIMDILYAYDEGTKPNATELNTLINFIHEKQTSWMRPKSVHELINDMMFKITGKPRQVRGYSGKPMTKDELVAIHNWVMSQK